MTWTLPDVAAQFHVEIGAARQQPRRALRARGCRSAAAGQTTSGNMDLLLQVINDDSLFDQPLSVHREVVSFFSPNTCQVSVVILIALSIWYYQLCFGKTVGILDLTCIVLLLALGYNFRNW